MVFRARGKGRISSLCARANTPRRRAAVMAGVFASVSVMALGTASAVSQDSGESTTAAVQAAPATDSAREHWEPLTHRSRGAGDPGTEPGRINTDFLISEVSPAQFRGWWYQSHVKGVDVTWVAPSGRDPYDGWDWIEIVDGSGKRVTWDWVCGNAHCGAFGSTLIGANLKKGEEYKALYWSDGGRVTHGRLRAEFEFRA
ncbi:hypothetical protein GCM10010211_75110 [Streptomyces albospinus]|uniref:Secreted protein n=1 Tax=Streptomyces albospinus TaxID=285515 RepID=A0ABQ2VLK1_9ACTN|nr:hypothetical protein [Streptomyces albospinus]GGU96751.1 hypothetical protein GCM10010211_75110 [Streptomyces albospinus]